MINVTTHVRGITLLKQRLHSRGYSGKERENVRVLLKKFNDAVRVE